MPDISNPYNACADKRALFHLIRFPHIGIAQVCRADKETLSRNEDRAFSFFRNFDDERTQSRDIQLLIEIHLFAGQRLHADGFVFA